MLLTRGPPGGHNEWADDLGLEGWGWADVEPYFSKMDAALDRPGEDYRGHEGEPHSCCSFVAALTDHR
jgi:choline dehydrogenase-like flavoprotein